MTASKYQSNKRHVTGFDFRDALDALQPVLHGVCVCAFFVVEHRHDLYYLDAEANRDYPHVLDMLNPPYALRRPVGVCLRLLKADPVRNSNTTHSRPLEPALIAHVIGALSPAFLAPYYLHFLACRALESREIRLGDKVVVA